MSNEHALSQLIDERDVVAVAVAYTWALDGRHWDALDDVFMADATAQLGTRTTLHGRDAIKQRIRAALEHLDDSQHLVGSHEVRIDGDTATHRCYLQAQHVRRAAEGGPHYVVAGRYEDRFVRIDAGWRIEHRTLTTMWTEGNQAVIHF